MATPPQQFSIASTKPFQTPIHNHHQLPPKRHSQQSHRSFSISSSLFHCSQTRHLSADFRDRRPTRLVSKLHCNRPRAASLGSAKHSPIAEQALHVAVHLPSSPHVASADPVFHELLLSFSPMLSAPHDYSFLLRELGNRGDVSKVLQCFHFAISRDRNPSNKGKLVSAIISILGRLGRVDVARSVFDAARSEGYGNTVYAYSALISAYARTGHSEDAIRLFDTMKVSGLQPNLVTYNAVIDACGKGGVCLELALGYFDEMIKNRILPDKITFNSLLSVSGRSGAWQSAIHMFNEMLRRGVETDVFTYNTLLDAVCKGGQMDFAMQIMSEMTRMNIDHNVVTYSTVIDGFAKAGKLVEALNLFDEMKCAGIPLDRVSYNTLVSIYSKLGRFDEALDVCGEMEDAGLRKDTVTYNALIGGYGRHGRCDAVKRLLEDMKSDNCAPNLLTYSTLIDMYVKVGNYREAMVVFKEFQAKGLNKDVVLYSALIDALCKNGLVNSAAALLDDMIKEGIRPNVVTFNSIIDAFGKSSGVQNPECGEMSDELPRAFLSGEESPLHDDDVMEIFGQFIVGKEQCQGEDGTGRGQLHDASCILDVFRKMHQLDVRPNVVTFSAILNICSCCNSFEDASMLLEELKLFDNQVYGVAHGLLIGYRGEIWMQAQSLFDEVKLIDISTACAFYNALTDMLWHFGQKHGAQLVALEGKRRQVWENSWQNYCLDLHLMSCGAAQAMVHSWLLNVRSIVFKGHELPKLLSILTGWGKHSKVAGGGTLKRAIEGLLSGIGAPFHVAKFNVGRFISAGPVVTSWLRESGTLSVLILHDSRTYDETGCVHFPELQLIPA